MFLVFCYLEEISKENYFGSSLDQRCIQCWKRKQPQQGAKPKSRTEQKEPGDTHIPHRAQRQHQQPQTPQLPLSTDNSSRRKCWSPSHSQPLAPRAHWGQDHLQRFTQAVVCGTGAHGTGSPNHSDLCPCSHSPHQAEPQGCCNRALGTPRQSKHEAQPGTGTGWTLGHSLSPARGERAPKPAVAAAQPSSLSTAGFQGRTKQLCLTQLNREGEGVRQNQGTQGAEKCSEWLQSTSECCVQGTQAASVPAKRKTKSPVMAQTTALHSQQRPARPQRLLWEHKRQQGTFL